MTSQVLRLSGGARARAADCVGKWPGRYPGVQRIRSRQCRRGVNLREEVDTVGAVYDRRRDGNNGDVTELQLRYFWKLQEYLGTGS